MKRREFIAATTAVAALGAVGVMGRSSFASSRARNITKAVKYGMVRVEGTVADKFGTLKRLGFDGVEVDGPSGLDKDEVLAAIESTGLPVHGVVCSTHWSKPLSHPDEAVRAEGLKGVETAIRDARTYGASSVLVVPAVVSKEVAYEDAYNRSQTELRKVIPLAEELGIDIAFENVWNNFLLSPLEAARYVDEFESDRVGWYFDVGNVVRNAWPEHWIRTLGDRVMKIDVKEYSRAKQNDEGLWKGFNVELLEGDCDWPAVMKALDDIGFEGWFTAEIGGGGVNRLEDIAARMDRIIAS